MTSDADWCEASISKNGDTSIIGGMTWTDSVVTIRLDQHTTAAGARTAHVTVTIQGVQKLITVTQAGYDYVD